MYGEGGSFITAVSGISGRMTMVVVLILILSREPPRIDIDQEPGQGATIMTSYQT